MKGKNTYASPYVKLVVLDQTDVLATLSGTETNDIIFNDDYKDGWGD